jgi:hypothetical protein
MYTVRIENIANGIGMSTKEKKTLAEKKLSCPGKKTRPLENSVPFIEKVR